MEVRPRGFIELDEGALWVVDADGRGRRWLLPRAEIGIADAELSKRFVRHVRIEVGGEHVDLVTPPEEGAIAPRCARTPAAPPQATVIDRQSFAVMVDWLSTGGSLRARTIAELASLATLSTSSYAVHIGERAAQIALEMSSGACGPLRGCDSSRALLGPLHDAARHSERASEALVAALARSFATGVPA